MACPPEWAGEHAAISVTHAVMSTVATLICTKIRNYPLIVADKAHGTLPIIPIISAFAAVPLPTKGVAVVGYFYPNLDNPARPVLVLRSPVVVEVYNAAFVIECPGFGIMSSTLPTTCTHSDIIIITIKLDTVVVAGNPFAVTCKE